jgi:5-methyltetrahydropteroyltriglutamate--homocysteine methyltransferase
VHDEEAFPPAAEPARAGVASSPAGLPTRPRVEHVGSLRPPRQLVEVLELHTAGATAADELRAVEDESIREAIALQERHGVDVVTDGELRRLRGRHALAERLSSVARFGLARTRQLPAGDHCGGASPVRATHLDRATSAAVVDPLPNALVDEYRFAAAIASRPVKVTLLGPDYLSHVLDPSPASAFREVFDSIVAFERAMIGEVVAAGCPYVQLDAPGYLAYADPVCVAEMRGRGIDPVADLHWAVQADNAVIDIETAGEAVFGVHMCRSYLHGRVQQTPVFDPFAEILFDELAHQRLLVDFDTTRSDAFAPLRFVPPGKEVVLGVVDSRHPRIETVEEVLRLVEQACRWSAVDDLALSPTCGFASSGATAPLTPDQQWRKLDVLAEVAARVWG